MSHPLEQALAAPDPGRRAQACREAGDDPSAVLLSELLLGALGDPSREVQRAAAETLARIAREDAATERELQKSLRAPQIERRPGALDACSRLAPPAPGWLPAIVDALDARSGELRWLAARLLVDLARLHPETTAVAAGLARDDPRPRVRRMALFSALQLAPDEGAARSLLDDAGDDRDPEVRRAAELGRAARSRRSTPKTAPRGRSARGADAATSGREASDR